MLVVTFAAVSNNLLFFFKLKFHDLAGVQVKPRASSETKQSARISSGKGKADLTK